MLEQFFGSKTRFELLNIFFNNANSNFYVRELVKISGMQLNSIRRELGNLENLGIIEEHKNYKAPDEFTNKIKCNLPIRRKYFRLNKDFLLLKEIECLIIKSKLLLEKKLIDRLNNLGEIKKLILTGIFTGVKKSSIDILIIGDNIEGKRVSELIDKFGHYVNRDINYAVLSEEEYKYRWGIKDKFLFSILDQEKIVIDNKKEKN